MNFRINFSYKSIFPDWNVRYNLHGSRSRAKVISFHFSAYTPFHFSFTVPLSRGLFCVANIVLSNTWLLLYIFSIKNVFQKKDACTKLYNNIHTESKQLKNQNVEKSELKKVVSELKNGCIFQV